MPASVVVGGQYGSEGKGKVALHVARTSRATVVVRVGGPNSGHSAADSSGNLIGLRQLPAAALAESTLVVLPAGNLVDCEILLREIELLRLDPKRLVIDAAATVIQPQHREEEARLGLIERIGSTGSGTGAALRARIERAKNHVLAGDCPELRRFVTPYANSMLREQLELGNRVVIEGTQGFGLSLWHSGHYPFATSRDTTAANFVAEAGIAPHDVDDVVMVIRAFPIRVGGDSGPLTNEIDWPTLAREANLPANFVELTTATKRVRRVARFDPDVVRKAIVSNWPHRVVLNHVDYVDPDAMKMGLSQKARHFVESVESEIERKVDLVGLGPDTLIPFRSTLLSAANG